MLQVAVVLLWSLGDHYAGLGAGGLRSATDLDQCRILRTMGSTFAHAAQSTIQCAATVHLHYPLVETCKRESLGGKPHHWPHDRSDRMYLLWKHISRACRIHKRARVDALHVTTWSGPMGPNRDSLVARFEFNNSWHSGSSCGCGCGESSVAPCSSPESSACTLTSARHMAHPPRQRMQQPVCGTTKLPTHCNAPILANRLFAVQWGAHAWPGSVQSTHVSARATPRGQNMAIMSMCDLRTLEAPSATPLPALSLLPLDLQPHSKHGWTIGRAEGSRAHNDQCGDCAT